MAFKLIVFLSLALLLAGCCRFGGSVANIDDNEVVGHLPHSEGAGNGI
jgi:hypothetical protein